LKGMRHATGYLVDQSQVTGVGHDLEQVEQNVAGKALGSAFSRAAPLSAALTALSARVAASFFSLHGFGRHHRTLSSSGPS
jgi:hypothetical protein